MIRLYVAAIITGALLSSWCGARADARLDLLVDELDRAIAECEAAHPYAVCRFDPTVGGVVPERMDPRW